MLPGAIPSPTKKNERRLIKLYRQLKKSDRHALLSFAEFLVVQAESDSASAMASESSSSENNPIPQPESIPRPEKESVVKAIKRLTMTYPMVDRESVLHPISGMMTEHIMQGKAADQVIDKLEVLFATQYENLINAQGQPVDKELNNDENVEVNNNNR